MKAFQIEGVTFVPDIRAGADRSESSQDCFTLVKTASLLDFYQTLTAESPKRILEIGMFEGGSLVWLDKVFAPTRIVGVDIRKEPIEPLEEYRKRQDGRMVTLYGQSQDDPSLVDMLKPHFPDGIDLIVDDASHMYQPTTDCLRNLWQLLNPGGVFLIEDWSWAHRDVQQNSDHPWFDKPALSNLMLQLALGTTGPDIEEVVIRNDVALVRKASGARPGPLDFGFLENLRGRPMPEI